MKLWCLYPTHLLVDKRKLSVYTHYSDLCLDWTCYEFCYEGMNFAADVREKIMIKSWNWPNARKRQMQG